MEKPLEKSDDRVPLAINLLTRLASRWPGNFDDDPDEMALDRDTRMEDLEAGGAQPASSLFA